MNGRIIGGLALICVIAVVAGVLFYINDLNKQEANNNTINNIKNNNITTNTTSQTNQLALTVLPDNQLGSNSSPFPNPSPCPGPTPNPMGHTISLFNAYLNKYYNQSTMPGMAVVIVQNGKIIYMKTLGVRDLTSKKPVDENTLFGICSISKQFTSTNIAQLVDKGLISWDDPISKYFSVPDEFLLYNDSNVSNNITIRDVLMHNSGLSRELGNEFPTYFNDSFYESIFKLRYVENSTPFRSTYAYNSLIYALGGYCAAKANNTTWNELIKEDLLDQLGMTTTTTSYWDFLSSPDHATPYKLLKNGTMVPYDIVPDPVGPAGSIYSSISEMANWLKFQIADTGYYNGVKIVSKKELDETRTPQINITDASDLLYGSQYGLGWFIRANSKDLPYYVSHPGDSDDFHAQITVYPSKGLGIVILTNGGIYSSSFRSVLDAKFRQLLIGNDDFDPWPATSKAIEAIWKPDSPTPPILGPTLPLKDYAGVYFNMVYGNITITSSNNTLICHYGTNNQAFSLIHFNGDVFNEPYNDFTFNFIKISNNKTNSLKVSLPDYATAPSNSTTTFNRTE